METAETTAQAPEFLSIPQAARLAGVSRVHVWRLVQAGTIPAIRVGADDRGPIRINRRWFVDWLLSAEQGAA